MLSNVQGRGETRCSEWTITCDKHSLEQKACTVNSFSCGGI